MRAVLGTRGMVASAHTLVSLTGARVLADGGNAYDAALAMAGMASVTLPAMCGPGGDAFAVVHDARRRSYTAYMGSGVGPDGADVAFFRDRGMSAVPIDGALSVSVPGAVDCWARLHADGATRDLSELFTPAVAAARDGFAMSRRMHDEALLDRAKLERNQAAAAVYLPNGGPTRPGAVLRQPDLAETLQSIAQDPRRFYDGDLAERCVTALRDGGAPFSGEEWSKHRTEVTGTVAGTYAGHTVHTTRPPSPGYMVLQQLDMLGDALRRREWLDAESVHLMATAARRAFDDRHRDVGSEGDAWRRLLTVHGDTTSFVAVDDGGNVVSLIQSIAFAWGSGVMVPGTGMLLNNRAGRGFYLDDGHPNRVRPGVRPMHTLNCWILAGGDGTPVVAGGTPGGDGQVQWNAQMLSHLLDHGRDVQEAVEAPRFAVWPGSDADVIGSPPELRCESRLGDAALQGLQARGHNVKRLGPWEGGGGAQLVAVDREHGSLRGGSDPRVDGCALGV